jgi:hypothetical protein
MRRPTPVERHPRLAHGTGYVPVCGGCRERMACVATIEEGRVDRRPFAGTTGVQVLYFLCGPCQRMHAFKLRDLTESAVAVG